MFFRGRGRLFKNEKNRQKRIFSFPVRGLKATRAIDGVITESIWPFCRAENIYKILTKMRSLRLFFPKQAKTWKSELRHNKNPDPNSAFGPPWLPKNGNITITRKYQCCCCLSKKSWPILQIKLLSKIGQDFLDIRNISDYIFYAI